MVRMQMVMMLLFSKMWMVMDWVTNVMMLPMVMM
jgi:hypothetical protein